MPTQASISEYDDNVTEVSRAEEIVANNYFAAFYSDIGTVADRSDLTH
jgi:hypothetical protein